MNHFLINEPIGFPIEAINQLSKNGVVHLSDTVYPEDKITVAFVRLSQKIGIEFHRRHPRLRWIVTPTTGLNHIDCEYFKSRNINVLSLRGEIEFLNKIHATAEHTIALVLSLIRRIPVACEHVQTGGWDRYPFQGRELNGKIVTILGFGRIGRQVEKIYSAFGCKVFAVDRRVEIVPKSLRSENENPYESADILSIHINLEKDNVQFVNHKIFDRLKNSCFIVNTSRGEVLDQFDLFRRIIEGRIGGAALDVLCDEPDPLRDPATKASIAACGSRLIITPHIAGFTKESLLKVENFIGSTLLAQIKTNNNS